MSAGWPGSKQSGSFYREKWDQRNHLGMGDAMPVNQDLLDIIAYGRPILEEAVDDVIRDIFNSFNAIIDIWEIDCEGEWVLWVKTGAQALGAALWLLITPSPQEIFESYLQPKPGRRGARRGLGKERSRHTNPVGRSRVWFRGGIPDLDNMIADRIPGRLAVAGRQLAAGEWLFWTGIQVADFVLWYWLVLEATETFATKWVSGLLESGQCKTPNDGTCQFQTPVRHSFENRDFWTGVDDLLFFHAQNLIVHNNTTVALPMPLTEADAMVIITANWQMVKGDTPGFASVTVGYNLQVRNAIGGLEKNIFKTATLSASQGETANLEVSGVHHVSNANTFGFQYVFQDIQGVGFDEVGAWSKVAVATRNTHVR